MVGLNFSSKIEGLAVFANFIDEMTFNYTTICQGFGSNYHSLWMNM